jgi:hypothetical protein
MAGKGIEFNSPVGRLVQGGFTLEQKVDLRTNQPKTNKDGTPMMECFLAIAIEKNNPDWPAFYGLIYQAARQFFPHLVDPTTQAITHPRFAFKIQDGDGVDNNGKSVADKPGFAGHWIVKMGTQFLPKCFHRGKYDPMQQIQNPNEVIKRGYYVRVNGMISGNGVQPGDPQAVPGLFISPNLVELFAPGEEITSGPDAAEKFGSIPEPAYIPAGAKAGMASGPVGMPGMPPLAPPPAVPGIPAPSAAPAVPAPASAPPAPPMTGVGGMPPPANIPAPPAPTGPVYLMTPKAQGATREAMQREGWTDAAMIEHGYMIQQ